MSEKTLGQVAYETYWTHEWTMTPPMWGALNAKDKAAWEAGVAAAIQAHEARQWQAIDRAPKDGTLILTWVGGITHPFPYICAWSDSYSIHGLGGNWSDGLCQMGVEVTHWTALPAPPQEVEHDPA